MWQKSRGWRNRSNASDQPEIPVQSKVTVKSEKLRKENDSIQAAAESLNTALESDIKASELPVVNIDTAELLTELPAININAEEEPDSKPLSPGAGDETTELPIFKEAAAFSVSASEAVPESGKKDTNAPTKELPVFEDVSAEEETEEEDEAPDSPEAADEEDTDAPKSAADHSDTPVSFQLKGEKNMESHVLHEAEKQTEAMEAIALSDSAEIANGGSGTTKAAEPTPEQKLETYRMKYERVLERCLVLGRQVQDLQVALAKAERTLQDNLIERRKIEDNQRAVLAAEGRVDQAKQMIDSILADSRKELAAAAAKATRQQEIAERAERAKAEAEKAAEEASRRAEEAEAQLHELARAARREQKQLLRKIEVMW